MVTDGEAPFHRVYVVGSGDSAQENETLSEDLNALRSAWGDGLKRAFAELPEPGWGL